MQTLVYIICIADVLFLDARYLSFKFVLERVGNGYPIHHLSKNLFDSSILVKII